MQPREARTRPPREPLATVIVERRVGADVKARGAARRADLPMTRAVRSVRTVASGASMWSSGVRSRWGSRGDRPDTQEQGPHGPCSFADEWWAILDSNQ